VDDEEEEEDGDFDSSGDDEDSIGERAQLKNPPQSVETYIACCNYWMRVL
jgi:hypothetical protein